MTNERRILSVDVALMASKKHKNDASSIILNSAIPKNNNTYISHIAYLENHEGLNTDELALLIMKLVNYILLFLVVMIRLWLNAVKYKMLLK